MIISFSLPADISTSTYTPAEKLLNTRWVFSLMSPEETSCNKLWEMGISCTYFLWTWPLQFHIWPIRALIPAKLPTQLPIIDGFKSTINSLPNDFVWVNTLSSKLQQQKSENLQFVSFYIHAFSVASYPHDLYIGLWSRHPRSPR